MPKRPQPLKKAGKWTVKGVARNSAIAVASIYGASVIATGEGDPYRISRIFTSDVKSGAEDAAPVAADVAGGAVDVTRGGLDGVTDGESISVSVERDGDSSNEGSADSSDSSIFNDPTIVAEAGDGWIDAFQREGYTFNQITECANTVGGLAALESIILVPGENPNPCAA